MNLRFDVVCLSHLRWDFVYQRPQHLLTRCGQERRDFFIEEPVGDSETPWLEVSPREQNITVVVPHTVGDGTSGVWDHFPQHLFDEFLNEQEIRQYVLWYYTPDALELGRHLDPLVTVYDCMDELSAFKGANPKLQAREIELLQRADLVFTGGHSLYESKRTQHKQVFAFPSSVDTDHFCQARQPIAEPADQAQIPSPKVGFYGVIDERMDLDLVAAIADQRPEWHVVMIGPVFKIEESSLPRGNNIHYLGSKSYAELPFAQNESTRFISPTKTPDIWPLGDRSYRRQFVMSCGRTAVWGSSG